MKKMFKICALACFGLLASCKTNEVLSSEQNNPSSSSGDSSSTTREDTSSTSNGNSSSTSEDMPTGWSQDDLNDMVTFLGEGVTLPFPIGFTANYVLASGTDKDGECFIVYDAYSGDLSASYSAQLIADGFIKDSSDDEGYIYFIKENITSDKDLWVQIDFVDKEFEIFAYLENATPRFETFPYSEINSFFSLSLSESNLPSFTLREGEKYDGYSSTDGRYFYVGGYIATNITDEDYFLDYAVKLEGLGYQVDLDNALATLDSLSFKVEFSCIDGYFFLQLSKYVVPAKGDYVMTITKADIPNSKGYNDGLTNIIVNEINLKYYFVMNANCIQFKRGSGANLYNVDSMGKITSIVVTADSNSINYYSPLTLYVSSSPISDTNVGTKVEYTMNNLEYVYNVTGNASYIKLVNEGKDYASKNTSIVINYSFE